jgi:DNA invertase Pin-like site-specific DNA recombinase
MAPGGRADVFVLVRTAVAVGNAYRRGACTRSTTGAPQSALAASAPAGDESSAALPLVEAAAATRRDSAGRVAAARTSSSLSPGSVVIGYATVATDPEPREEHEAASAIETMCERSRWELLEVVHDSDEGPSLERPGLHHALELIVAGEATGMVMKDLERLSGSIVDLGALMAWFRDAGRALVVLDPNIDTSTPEGSRVAQTLIALSAGEHERIAVGTRRGFAKGRASGHPTGRPAVSDRPELVERIAAMRAADMTLRAIAEQLNAEGVPTLRGGKKWRPSSIHATLGYRRRDPRDHLPSPHPRARQ